MTDTLMILKDFVVPAGGVIFGSFVGWWGSSRSTSRAIDAQDTRDKNAEKSEIRAILQAIRDEVHTLAEVHMEGGGGNIKAASGNEPIAMFYPISDHYFTTFETNASRIGKVTDAAIRRQIIRTYVLFKSLVDTIRLNNHFSGKLELAEAAHRNCSLDELEATERECVLQWQQMTSYAPQLKASNDRAMDACAALISAIDEWMRREGA
ncbi:hypothetical protein [Stenotrophomonas maltophilia]|uniref:hypothetical protein n=1 Tax=Stenotrophomonas maltophilia TaxID=40324 RepID=UPI0015C56474|nr:hypothetical protein [Stenotrophomonas maltophilia]